MSSQVVVGQLGRGRLVFEWQIPDFLSLSADERYRSAVYSVGGTSWYIRVYPNGRAGDASQGYVGVYVCRRDSGPPVTVSYCLFLKTKAGRKAMCKEEKDTFARKDDAWGRSKALKRSELIDRQSEFLPSGALTIVCCLKFDEGEVKANQSSSSEEHFETKQEEKASPCTGETVRQSSDAASQSSDVKLDLEDSTPQTSWKSNSSQTNATSNSPVQCPEPSTTDQSVTSDQSSTLRTRGIKRSPGEAVNQCSSSEKQPDHEAETCSSSSATAENSCDTIFQSSGEKFDREDSPSLSSPSHASSNQTSPLLKSSLQSSVPSIWNRSYVSYQSLSSYTYGLEKLSQNLKDLYIQNKGHNLIFRVGDKEYRAHQSILRARVPVFDAAFSGEDATAVIPVEDCDPEIFQDFLLYIYTGRVDNLSHENVSGLSVMARKYGLHHLRNVCTKFLRSSHPTKRNDNLVLLA